MRDITKALTILIDGKPFEFRLTKLDAFSGAALLRMLSRMPEGSGVQDLLTGLSDGDLRSLMITCLQHAEVLLPAGWIPIMTRGEWSYPEVEHDTAVCLKLTVEEVLWTLEGFFGERGSASRSEIPDS